MLYPDTPVARAEGANFTEIDQRGLARVVGLTALCLPTLMVFAAFTEIPPFDQTCYRNSISHYYYAPFLGSIFIGALVFIGAYLMVYRGTKQPLVERVLARLAGVFAIGIALFPTAGDGCKEAAFHARAFVQFERATSPEGGPTGPALPQLANDPGPYFELFDALGGLPISSATLHYLCAALLFAFLAWFSLKIFTRTDAHQRLENGEVERPKLMRNTLYLISGWVIVGCILAMGAAFVLESFTSVDIGWWDANNLTFWFEAVALWAFGLSWMVKARFWGRSLLDSAEVAQAR